MLTTILEFLRGDLILLILCYSLAAVVVAAGAFLVQMMGFYLAARWLARSKMQELREAKPDPYQVSADEAERIDRACADGAARLRRLAEEYPGRWGPEGEGGHWT